MSLEIEHLISEIGKKEKKRSNRSIELHKLSMESTSVNNKKNHFSVGAKHLKNSQFNNYETDSKMIKDHHINSEIGYKNSASSSPHSNEFDVDRLKYRRKNNAFTNPATSSHNSIRQQHSGNKRKNCDSDRFSVAKRAKPENGFENVVRTNLKVGERNGRFTLEERHDNELFFFDIAGNRRNSYVELPILNKINIETTASGISNTKNCKDKKKKRNKMHKLEVTKHAGSCSKTNTFIDFSEDSSLLDRLMENFSKDLNNMKENIQTEEEKKPLKIKKDKVDSDNKPKKKKKTKYPSGEILVDIRDSDCEVTTFHECMPVQRKKRKNKIFQTECGTEAERARSTKTFDISLCENGNSELEKDENCNNNVNTTNGQLLDKYGEIVGNSESFVSKKKKKKKKHLHTETHTSMFKKERSVTSENSVSHKITNAESDSNLKGQKSGLIHIKDSDCEISNEDDSSLIKKQKKKKKKKKDVILEHKTSEAKTPQGELSTLSQSGNFLARLLEDWSNESDVIEITEESSELPKSVEDRDCEAVEASDSPSTKKRKKHKENTSFKIITANHKTLQNNSLLDNSLGNVSKESIGDDSNKGVKKNDSEAIKKKKKRKTNGSESTDHTPKREQRTSLESVFFINSSAEKLNSEYKNNSNELATIDGSSDSSLKKKKKKKKDVESEHKTSETNALQEQSTLSQSCGLLGRLLEEWSNESELIDNGEERRSLKEQNNELLKSVKDIECEVIEASDSPLPKKKKKKKKHNENESYAIDTDYRVRNISDDNLVAVAKESVRNSDSEAVKKKKKKKSKESYLTDTTIENTLKTETSLESVHIDGGLDTVGGISDSSSLKKKKKKKKKKRAQENTSNESTSETKRETFESSSHLDEKAGLSKCKDNNNDSQVIIDGEVASISDSSSFPKKKKKQEKSIEINTESPSKDSSIRKNGNDVTQTIINYIEDDKTVSIIDSLVRKKKKKKKRQEENTSSGILNNESSSNSKESKHGYSNSDAQTIIDDEAVTYKDPAFSKKKKKKKHHEGDPADINLEELDRTKGNSSTCIDNINDIQVIADEGVDKAVYSAFKKKKKRQQKNTSAEIKTEDTSIGERKTSESSDFLTGKGNSSVSKTNNNHTQDSIKGDNSATSISDSSLPKKKKKKKRQEESTSSEINVENTWNYENSKHEGNNDDQVIIDDVSEAVCNSDSAFLKKKKKKKKHSEDDSTDINFERMQKKEFETSLESSDIIDGSGDNLYEIKDKIREIQRKLEQQNSESPETAECNDYNVETNGSLSRKKKKKKKWKLEDFLADSESTVQKGDERVDNLGKSRDDNDEQIHESCLDIKDIEYNAESINNFAFSESKKEPEELGNGPSSGCQDFSTCSKLPYTSSPKNNDEEAVTTNALKTTLEKALKSESRDEEVLVDIADSESDLKNEEKKKRRDMAHQLETNIGEATGLNCNNSSLDTIERNGLDNVKKPSCVLLKYDSESTTSKNSYYHEIYTSSSEGYKSESSEIISSSKKLIKKRSKGASSVKIVKSDCDNTSEVFKSTTSPKTKLNRDKKVSGGGEQNGRSKGHKNTEQIVANDFNKTDGDKFSQLDGILQEMTTNNNAASVGEKDTRLKQEGRQFIEEGSSARLVKLEDFNDESGDESHIMHGSSSINCSKDDMSDDIEKLQQIDIVLQFSLPPLHSILTRSSVPTPEQRKEIKNRKIEVKHGPFTKEEDEKILDNWGMFCKEYDLRMVPSIFVSLPRKMPTVQRTNFLRYLARGLNNRLLDRVHARFKILVQKNQRKSGRFTPEEDATILQHVNESSSNFPFRDLSELLNRCGLSVEKRYIRLSAENKDSITWTTKLVGKLVKYLKRVTKCEGVDELKHKKLNAEVWHQLSDKMDNIPALKLERAWNNTIYPRLFADSDMNLKQIKIRLIEMIDNMNETDWRKVNWKKIAEEFPGFTHLRIYMMFKQLVYFHVPKEKHGNLKVCVKFLRDKLLSSGVVSKPRRFTRFVYEDGHMKKRPKSPTV